MLTQLSTDDDTKCNFLFEGDRRSFGTFIRRHTGHFYVYLLCRQDGRPFYVGKGKGLRATQHESEADQHHPFGEANPFKCNVIRKIKRMGGAVLYRVDSIFPTDREQDCLEREADLIRQHRRLHEGGILTNLAGGVGNISGSAPFSRKRHADTLSGMPEHNLERATLNRYLQGFVEVGSVPIKPLTQISRVLPSTPHPSARKPTARSACALVASAGAHGISIGPGIHIPRKFVFERVEAIIENGASRDILKAGLATLVSAANPSDEVFALSAAQAEMVVKLVGRRTLEARGLV